MSFHCPWDQVPNPQECFVSNYPLHSFAAPLSLCLKHSASFNMQVPLPTPINSLWHWKRWGLSTIPSQLFPFHNIHQNVPLLVKWMSSPLIFVFHSIPTIYWETLPYYCLEKEMATHSSILAWRISRTEEPGGLHSTGLQRVGHDWATSHARTVLLDPQGPSHPTPPPPTTHTH